MNGRNVVIKAEDWQKYLQTYGYRQSDIDEILKRAEKIPSDQLDADRRARLLKFLKGTKHEASLDDVNAALVSTFVSILERIVVFSTIAIVFIQFYFSLQAYLYGSE